LSRYANPQSKERDDDQQGPGHPVQQDTEEVRPGRHCWQGLPGFYQFSKLPSDSLRLINSRGQADLNRSALDSTSPVRVVANRLEAL